MFHKFHRLTALPMIVTLLIAAPVLADEVLVSQKPDRSSPSLLNGGSLYGDVYIYFTTATLESQIDSVEFFIDGTQITKDNKVPFDLAGGTTTVANPYDTLKRLSDGVHVMDVVLAMKDGSTRRSAASFVVGNAFAPVTVSGDLKVITAAANVDSGTLTLTGFNFDRRSGYIPRVSLDLQPIQVTASSGQWLIASLPSGLSVGEHTINVSTDGVLAPGLTDRDHADLLVTVGAVGPAGPEGPAGPAGIGDITAVLAGTGLSGGGASGGVSLALDTTFTDGRYAPATHGHSVTQITNAATLGANTFSGDQTITGNAAISGHLNLGSLRVVSATTCCVIQGEATGTGGAIAVVGKSASTSGGAGVYGLATAANGTGSTHGVLGETQGMVGAAVRGLARQGLGVEGTSLGENGMAMLAQMPNSTGNGTAFMASVNSATATPGVFQNNGGGNLLIGRVSGAERFRIDGAGSVFATSYRDLAGNPIASGDITSVTVGTGLTGGGVSGEITLGLNTVFTDGRYAPSLHGHDVSQIANAASLSANTFGATQTIDSGNLDLDPSTATAGNILKNGSRFLHNFGINNTFLGLEAGNLTTTGDGNVGVGSFALRSITSGQGNVAIGSHAFESNASGFNNTAVGEQALRANVTGRFNAGFGSGALINSIGNNNVAVGHSAGANTTTGSNNIYLGALVFGLAGESNTIYIGNQGVQSKTFVAGVRGITTVNPDAVPVMIDSTGQLGTISSSRRYKEDIRDMGDTSQRLFELRPVTFRYAQAYGDGSKPIQYGLVAEEVAEVFPELAVRDTNGRVETVHYETLNVLLLNELKKQQNEILRLRERIESIEQRLAPTDLAERVEKR